MSVAEYVAGKGLLSRHGRGGLRTCHPSSASSRSRKTGLRLSLFPLAFAVVLLLSLSGCATAPSSWPPPPRAFEFPRDTFSYPNQLVREYQYDAQGHWTSHPREPKPDYTLHCFVVARSAAQFFENARFDPAQPKADEETYRRLVRRVVGTNPRRPLPSEKKIIIPGYPDLRSFSREHESSLKKECGSAFQSYFQRGNWRMVFPFSRKEQRRMADQIQSRLSEGHPVLVHLVRFPQLSINHTVLLIGSKTSESAITFVTYDPNEVAGPTTLVFDRRANTFLFPSCPYFQGGRVDAYQIYHRWDY
ncbi:MAG TPA: hypothetical protein VHI52_21980 [Verrucomicrobiae bacterium]|nr:hypothetical protein [Verrucomicrobiae bacterium]